MPLWVRLLTSAFCLVIAIGFFVAAKRGLETGRIRLRYRWISRRDDPNGFALSIAICAGLALSMAFKALLPSSW